MAASYPYGKFAEVYDSVMNQDLFYEQYYSFIVEVFRELKVKPRNILDLGCGTGKLAQFFLKGSYDVEGLDISSDMLKVAAKRGINVHQGSMASFSLDKKFDSVVSIFDSLNYLTSKREVKKCFNNVNKHLNDGGLFIFDVNTPFKINNVTPNKFSKVAYFKQDNIELVWLNSHNKDTWIVDLVIFQKEKNGLYKRFDERHVEKAYGLTELRKLLKDSGFVVAGVYSDFDFSAVRKNSWKWFFVCRKQG